MAGPAPTYQPTFAVETSLCASAPSDGSPRRSIRSHGRSWRCCCTRSPRWTTWRPGGGWGSTRTGCARGARSGRPRGSGWRTGAGRGASPLFPPREIATVTALACELPTQREQPLSRYSTADLTRLIAAHPDAPPMSVSTIWRLLDQDALKPWRHRSWLFPRDPEFAAKAGRVLDLYAGWWGGQPLDPADCIISADEKTSIQARMRIAPTIPPRPGQAMRVEHEYARGGALAYLAAWDVRRGGGIGRCDASTGIGPFGQLVDLVMQQEPYRSAPRVADHGIWALRQSWCC